MESTNEQTNGQATAADDEDLTYSTKSLEAWKDELLGGLHDAAKAVGYILAHEHGTRLAKEVTIDVGKEAADANVSLTMLMEYVVQFTTHLEWGIVSGVGEGTAAPEMQELAGIRTEPAAAHKNEIPEVERDSSDICEILQDLRYDVDRYFHGRKPLTLEEYGSICNMIHQADHVATLINSKATDHTCAAAPATADEDAAKDIEDHAAVIHSAALALIGELPQIERNVGLRRAHSLILERVEHLRHAAAHMRMGELGITMHDTDPKTAERTEVPS